MRIWLLEMSSNMAEENFIIEQKDMEIVDYEETIGNSGKIDLYTL